MNCTFLITNKNGSVATVAPDSTESNLYQAQQAVVTSGYKSTGVWTTVRGLEENCLTSLEIKAALDGRCDLRYDAILLDPKKAKPAGMGSWEHQVQLWVAHPSERRVEHHGIRFDPRKHSLEC